MSRRSFRDENEARYVFEKEYTAVREMLELGEKKMSAEDFAWLYGNSIIEHIFRMCEALTYMVCCRKADPEGTEEFPKMKDLKKKGDLIDMPYTSRLAADAICRIRNSSHKNGVTAGLFDEFLEALKIFAGGMVCDVDVPPGMLMEIADLIKGMQRDGRERESKIVTNMDLEQRLNFTIFNRDDLDEMDEEELDRLYRPKKTNNRKNLAPLYVYLTLKESSSMDRPMQQGEILDVLKRDYEVEISRQTLGRHLNGMVQDDIFIHRKNDGYFYDEELTIPYE